MYGLEIADVRAVIADVRLVIADIRLCQNSAEPNSRCTVLSKLLVKNIKQVAEKSASYKRVQPKVSFDSRCTVLSKKLVKNQIANGNADDPALIVLAPSPRKRMRSSWLLWPSTKSRS